MGGDGGGAGGPGRYAAWLNRRPPVKDAGGLRRRILEYLAAEGPKWGDEAAAALGLSPDAWWEAVKDCRWVTCTSPRRGACGWVPTAEGLAELGRAPG